MTLVFEKTLKRASEIRSFQIHHERAGGWQSCETANHGVARRHHLTDWHHVERIVARFNEQVAALQSSGWQDTSVES
jgi:hypothetical protein